MYHGRVVYKRLNLTCTSNLCTKKKRTSPTKRNSYKYYYIVIKGIKTLIIVPNN